MAADPAAGEPAPLPPARAAALQPVRAQRSRRHDRQRTYYRPKFAAEYAVATNLNHPRSVDLRENQLLPRIDERLPASSPRTAWKALRSHRPLGQPQQLGGHGRAPRGHPRLRPQARPLPPSIRGRHRPGTGHRWISTAAPPARADRSARRTRDNVPPHGSIRRPYGAEDLHPAEVRP